MRPVGPSDWRVSEGLTLSRRSGPGLIGVDTALTLKLLLLLLTRTADLLTTGRAPSPSPAGARGALRRSMAAGRAVAFIPLSMDAIFAAAAEELCGPHKSERYVEDGTNPDARKPGWCGRS